MGWNPIRLGREKVAEFKLAAQSKQTMIEYLEAPHAKGEDADAKNRWSNIDLAQSPIEDRKWTKWTYLAFWVAHAAGVGNWTAGSSLISLGLYPLDTWLCLASSHILITIFIVMNGRGPARYHIGFPMMARSTYGMWGSYLILSMRAIVCIIWNGVNSYYGGRLVSVAIGAVFPSWRRMPNTLPASAAITTTQLGGFLIFMLVFICLAFIHSRDLKPLYYFKSVYVSICMHAVLIWFMVKSGGVSFTSFGNGARMPREQHIWLVLQAFNAGIGTASSLAVNQGDMARYANTPNAQLWTTLIGYPIASALPCLYGILVAAASQKLTGKAIWNIWDTLEVILDSDPDNHANRFFVFLLAFGFALAYVALNLATNALPFGSDVSALFPRWMTIRRGQVLSAFLGVCIVPWKLLNSATAFITFVSGYGYWLAPIAACLSTDYFIIKKGNIKLHDLWVGDSSSRFWFYRGWNFRAVFATVAALLPCMPAFLATLSPTRLGLSLQTQRMFYISFTLSYVIGGVLYYLMYLLFPEKNLVIRERDLKFEQWADELDAREKEMIARQDADERAERAEDGAEKDEKDVEPSNTKVQVLSSS